MVINFVFKKLYDSLKLFSANFILLLFAFNDHIDSIDWHKQSIAETLTKNFGACFDNLKIFIILSGSIYIDSTEYFLKLTSYSDVRHSYSYSQHVSNRMLTFYRLGGMLMFYIISYTLHPKRLFRILSNVKNKREESRLDMALIQLIDRLKGNKKNLQKL